MTVHWQKNGRGGGIRTHDPLLPKQMRYQAALRPDRQHSNPNRGPLQTRTRIYLRDMSLAGAKLTLLDPGDPFPDVSAAWGEDSDAPGLLAVGGALDVDSLKRAYANGIFPWFSHGQPTLWWSPNPRMVLRTADFKLHRSLRRTLMAFRKNTVSEVRIDSAFSEVIRACAGAPRSGQDGTWIVPQMVRAYEALHAAGFAHSVETWIDGQLVGGLYCVALGGAVFGESMFARQTDASKIALSALVALCREHQIATIDCQQNTRHLASLGAQEMPRAEFMEQVAHNRRRPSAVWRFEPLYWKHILSA
jgi:leucyl/phenylalanyl-tRNA---protein transferase